jgi:hypothetical protein
MYAGYMLAYYVAATAFAVVKLPSHSRPVMGAFAVFVVWPALVMALSWQWGFGIKEHAKIVPPAISSGRLSRTFAVGAGFCAGVLVIAAIAAIWYASEFLFDAPGWVPYFATGLVLFLGPWPAATWILNIAQGTGTRPGESPVSVERNSD